MEDIKILLRENNKEIRKEIREDARHDIKEAIDESEGRIKRHISVLSEDFKSQVALIGEQHGSIMQKLDSNTEMIGGMKEDIEVIKMNVEFMKNSLKKKVDLEEFESLEKRVSLLESKAHA